MKKKQINPTSIPFLFCFYSSQIEVAHTQEQGKKERERKNG